MPFNTRRSSTRGTPRGLFGSKASMIDHSASVSSYRRSAIKPSITMKNLNHAAPQITSRFMSLPP
ncbi:hypothetical protein, partial [uncultured Croceicoccus sp.]|uniref:hypothetical protein n=1 Tax=uncultured Croceicoccus sp. TaxID=1295329 RepID=UPI002629624F